MELALTGEQKAQGLSDRDFLPPGTGMLFPYEESRIRTFWMKNMHFPLDMIWIDADCTVAHVTDNVPPPTPGTSNNDLPTYSSTVPVLHVLEVNAGDFEQNSIGVGDKVKFSGTLEGRFGC